MALNVFDIGYSSERRLSDSNRLVSVPAAEGFRLFYKRQLVVVNVLIVLLGIAAMGFAGFLSYATNNNNPATIALAVFCCLLTLLGALGIRAGLKELYRHLMLYMYGVMAITPALLVLIVACFAFQSSWAGYVRHYWDTNQLDYVRNKFCESGTAYTTCYAPAGGGSAYNDTYSWCVAGCPLHGDADGKLLCSVGSTDCPTIVDDARHKAIHWLQGKFTALGGACIGCFTVLLLGTYFCVKLLTMPIVMKRMLIIVNVEGILPVIVCILSGAFMLSHQTFQEQYVWLGYLYVVVGCYISVLVLFGIFAGLRKEKKYMWLYFWLDAVALALCMCVCLGCWVLSAGLPHRYHDKTDHQVQHIACAQSLRGCCCCDQEIEFQCPEWTRAEIVNLAQTELTVLGFIAFTVVFFMGIGGIGAYSWAKSLEGYQAQSI